MFEKIKNYQKEHYFSIPPKFDPEKGITVFKSDKEGYGHWIGGHDVVYDPETNKYYLYCRIRTPLGTGRGFKCIIAESNDGEIYNIIWEAKKEQLNANSIEVGCLIKDPSSGLWRLYISYETKKDVWRVDIIEADHPKNFDIWHHRTVMQPSDYGVEFIKDPKLYVIGGLYHAFVNVNAKERWIEGEGGIRHPLGDDATALMTSPDGKYFRNLQYIFEPSRGAPGEWGLYKARINSIIYLPPVYIGFIDMGSTLYDTYEEWCGVAISHDLEKWKRVTTDKPWIKSKYGSIRYVEAILVGEEIWYYYEYTCEDGSHELRVSKVSF